MSSKSYLSFIEENRKLKEEKEGFSRSYGKMQSLLIEVEEENSALKERIEQLEKEKGVPIKINGISLCEHGKLYKALTKENEILKEEVEKFREADRNFLKKLKIRRYESLAYDDDGKLKHTDYPVVFYGRCEACNRVYELSTTLKCVNTKCNNQGLTAFD